MNINDKLDTLNANQLRTVIRWTLTDLITWTNNGALPEVSRFAAMLDEAVRYQVDKAFKQTMNEEE